MGDDEDSILKKVDPAKGSNTSSFLILQLVRVLGEADALKFDGRKNAPELLRKVAKIKNNI